MEINKNLDDHNTFRIKGMAMNYSEVRDKKELEECIEWAGSNNKKVYILGGGSNILLKFEADRGVGDKTLQ